MTNEDMLPKYKVAILYIATGRYNIFWEYFYRSAEQFLLKDCEKHFFIFSDSLDYLVGEDQNDVTRIEQRKMGWPFDTLLRFEIFLSIENQLQNFDYVFFFNGNTEILSEIRAVDLLPLSIHQKLVFAHQPHLFHNKINKYTYERNPESLAYIPYNCGHSYFTGALNGGEVSSYLEMCKVLAKNIQIDLSNNIIALWHDESHLNHYALNRNDIKILPPYFTRGETEYWKTHSKVMFSDKTHFRFGGHAYLRGETDQKISQNEWENKHGKKRSRFKFRFKQFVKSIFL